MNKAVYTDPDINGKRDQFVLYKDYHYILTNGKQIIIPKGYVTDMASIPRFFWVIWPPHSVQYRIASLVHDYLYIEPTIVTSRKFADAEFKRILIHYKTNIITANIFYLFIRLFGWYNWNKFKKKLIQNNYGKCTTRIKKSI
jgi:hypothetical protein